MAATACQLDDALTSVCRQDPRSCLHAMGSSVRQPLTVGGMLPVGTTVPVLVCTHADVLLCICAMNVSYCFDGVGGVVSNAIDGERQHLCFADSLMHVMPLNATCIWLA